MLLMLAYISMLTHTAAFLFNITTWCTVDHFGPSWTHIKIVF